MGYSAYRNTTNILGYTTCWELYTEFYYRLRLRTEVIQFSDCVTTKRILFYLQNVRPETGYVT